MTRPTHLGASTYARIEKRTQLIARTDFAKISAVGY